MTIICPICHEEKSNLNGIVAVKIFPNITSEDPLPLKICADCAKKYGFEVILSVR